jgi:hypothetical protein
MGTDHGDHEMTDAEHRGWHYALRVVGDRPDFEAIGNPPIANTYPPSTVREMLRRAYVAGWVAATEPPPPPHDLRNPCESLGRHGH